MPSPNVDDVYSLIGFALTYIQTVERQLKFVTTYVLQDGGELNLDKLQSINDRERKKALGYFMVKVRERAELHPALDQFMSTYLSNRNDFIHNQGDIPGWDLGTEEGITIAKAFTSNLLKQAHKINEVFIALVMRWQEQSGIYPPESTNNNAFFRSIEKRYGPLLDVLFTARPKG